jgi:outer membrane lipoprotein-sorting protein
MIVLRTASGAGVQVISPGARTVQVVAADEAGLKGGVLALLDAGFPRSYEEFEKRFRLEAVETVAAGGWRVTTQLRDSALALAVQRMVFVLDEAGARLRSLEVWLRDGSRVENYFTLLEENVTVPDSLFREATDGFREVK